MVPFIVHDDVEAAADMVRPFYALYFGGMGAKGKNFHANVPIRMGYEAEVAEIQDLYLAGKKNEAAAAIPMALIDELSLIGPADKIRHDLDRWRESVVTTLLVAGDVTLLRIGRRAGARMSTAAQAALPPGPKLPRWMQTAGFIFFSSRFVDGAASATATSSASAACSIRAS